MLFVIYFSYFSRRKSPTWLSFVCVSYLTLNTSSMSVHSEIFARVLFSRKFTYAKFHENKSSRPHEFTKSLCRFLTWVNHALVASFNVANKFFNAIRENKILAKISEFTVPRPVCVILSSRVSTHIIIQLLCCRF